MKRGNNKTKITADCPSLLVDEEDADNGGAGPPLPFNLGDDEDDAPPLPIHYRESAISGAKIAAKTQQLAGRSGIPSDAAASEQNGSTSSVEEDAVDNTSYSMSSGEEDQPSPLLPHDDEELLQCSLQQQTAVSGYEEDTQVSSVDMGQEREPSVPLIQACLVEESEDDVVYDAEVVEVVFGAAELVEPDSPWRKHRIFIIFCISVLALSISLGVGLGVAFSTSCFVTRNELKAAVDDYVRFRCERGANVCRNITSKYGWPMNSWCVGYVTDMSTLFRDKGAFNEDISSWDVSKVQDMSYMFRRAFSFNRDLSFWDVSKVQDMSGMFAYAKSFNGDLSLWNVSQVQDMDYMFYYASSFNGNISLWDVSLVQDMSWMFSDASSFNGDLYSWDVSGVQDMSWMFYNASSFNQNLCEWADKNFPYANASSNIFANSGCTYQSTPQVEQGGPFCASTCI